MKTLLGMAGLLVASLGGSGQADDLFQEEPPKTTIERYRPGRDAARESRRAAANDERLYNQGTRALDQGQWERALEAFDQVGKGGGPRADGALYWKAYAAAKLGRQPEALSALEQLRKQFPSSQWLNDAKALELETRQASGQKVAPDKETDDELILIALNGLIHTDPQRALPYLDKLLQGSHSPRVKDRALFVLCQSGSPGAREVVVRIARGKANPDLQLKAIRQLGLFSDPEARQVLSEIYSSSTNFEVKKAVLRSFMTVGDRTLIRKFAQGEPSLEIRRDAFRHLGAMGAEAEIWGLYKSETSAEMRKALLEALYVSRDSQKLLEVARGDSDPELRRMAVRHLGSLNDSNVTDSLVSLYANEKDLTVRREVIRGFFAKQNAKAIVEVARKETDPTLKKDLVSRLSMMKSKEGTDYLMEILNK